MENLVKKLHKIRGPGIPRPSVVVIGDSDVRKTNLIHESVSKLYGLGLELRDTKIPVVLRFVEGTDRAEYFFEHGEEKYAVHAMTSLYREICKATNEDMIDNGEVTIVVKKRGALENLVIVDYPDFRRRPSKQKIGLLKSHYLDSDETVILNVVVANSPDFLSTHHSLNMLTHEMLEKMLLVIACSEESPRNLLDIVKASDYWNKCGLGVAFIRQRNKFRMEPHSLAIWEERELFRTHEGLCLIDKSIVGIPQLLDKLGRIQSTLLGNCLPKICRVLDGRLNDSALNLSRLLPAYAPLVTFVRLLLPFIERTLSSFLEFQHDDDHQTTIAHPKQLLKLLDQSQGELSTNFLSSEIEVVTNITDPQLAFSHVIKEHITEISPIVVNYFHDWCDNVEAHVKTQFLVAFDERYEDHFTSMSKAAAYAVRVLKRKLTRSLLKCLEAEKVPRYKCDPLIEEKTNHLMVTGLEEFQRSVLEGSHNMELEYYQGSVDVSHLEAYPIDVRNNAYLLKVRLFIYLPAVYQGLVDTTALHFRTLITSLAQQDLQSDILQELASSGELAMMEMFACPPGYDKGNEEKELERELALYAATKAIATRATKWLPRH